MLVLTREKDQWVELYDETGKVICRIVVSKIRGDQVKLGFEAGKGVRIEREERKACQKT